MDANKIKMLRCDVEIPDNLTRFTVDQVAQITHRTTGRVEMWCRSGALRATKVGKRWLISYADLAVFLGEPAAAPRAGGVQGPAFLAGAVMK